MPVVLLKDVQLGWLDPKLKDAYGIAEIIRAEMRVCVRSDGSLGGVRSVEQAAVK